METSQPWAYENIQLKPLAGSIGAIVEGIDLTRLDPGSVEEIRHAFINYQLLLFRQQAMAPEDIITFGNYFGTLSPFLTSDTTPTELLRIKDTNIQPPWFLNNLWYSDQSFSQEPPAASIVFCSECDGFGGETVFATQSLAYSSLSETTRTILDKLRATHVFDQNEVGERMSASHPVVRTLEDTGVKAIFVNAAFTQQIDGMKEAESRMLLNFLFDHVTQEAFTCRFTWEKNTLAIWDNRCVQHFNLANQPTGHRTLYKASTLGQRIY